MSIVCGTVMVPDSVSVLFSFLYSNCSRRRWKKPEPEVFVNSAIWDDYMWVFGDPWNSFCNVNKCALCVWVTAVGRWSTCLYVKHESAWTRMCRGGQKVHFAVFIRESKCQHGAFSHCVCVCVVASKTGSCALTVSHCSCWDRQN